MDVMEGMRYLHNSRFEWVEKFGSTIRFYFGDGQPDHRSTILCLGRYTGKNLYFYRKNQFSAQMSLIGKAPHQSIDGIVSMLEKVSYEQPILVSSKILSRSNNQQLAMELTFDDGLCFRFGDLPSGNLIEFISYAPDDWYSLINVNQRNILKNPRFELSYLIYASALGLPLGSSPRMDYLKSEAGIDEIWLAEQGLTDLFNQLVAKHLAAKPQSSSPPLSQRELPSQSELKARDASPVRHSEKSPSDRSKHQTKECCICFEDIEKSFVLVPCGHSPFCENCAQIEKCPICRGSIQQRITLYQAL